LAFKVMGLVTTHAIPIKTVAYGEADLIVTFLTRAEGRVTCIAKAARKSRKRFGGSLSLFCITQIVYSQKPQKGGLPLLSEASAIRSFENILADVSCVAYASCWAELVLRWTHEGEPGEELFNLLSGVLSLLDFDTGQAGRLHLIYQMRFLLLAGMAPRLDSCAVCSKPLDEAAPDGLWFDNRAGGLLCKTCFDEKGRGVRVDAGTIKLLSWTGKNSLDQALRARFSGPALMNATKLLESFTPFHLGQTIKSLDFLRRLREVP
jgi:DNA repair protein RecO (recombination protein O)